MKRSGKTRANGNNPALKHIEKWLIPVAAILLTADAFLLFFLLPSTLKLIGIITLAILAWLVTGSYYQKKPLLQNGKAQKTNGMVAVGPLGEILSRLDPDEYKIYDEIQTPYGKIDHVVIKSNGGVFLIEVKPQLGKVTVKNGTLLIDGKKGEKNLVREARRNTYEIEWTAILVLSLLALLAIGFFQQVGLRRVGFRLNRFYFLYLLAAFLLCLLPLVMPETSEDVWFAFELIAGLFFSTVCALLLSFLIHPVVFPPGHDQSPLVEKSPDEFPGGKEK